MRFFLIVFALTLFLVASASPINPLNYSPKVTACIKSMDDLGVEMSAFPSTASTTLKSALNDPTILSNFLDSKGSNVFRDLDAGYQHAITVCDKVTSLSKGESTAIIQAYAGLIKNTESYARTLLFFCNQVERVSGNQGKSAKISLKQIVASGYENYVNFGAHFYRLIIQLIIQTESNGFVSSSDNIDYYFGTLYNSLESP